MALQLIAAAVKDAHWMEQARCLNLPVDHFAVRLSEQAEAQEVCRGCPVQFDCFTYAMELQPTEGVWGGFVWKDGQPWR